MNLGTVRARLTLWNIGVLALSLISFALAIVVLVRTAVYESVDQQLFSTAEHMAQDWPYHRMGGDPGPPPEGRGGDRPPSPGGNGGDPGAPPDDRGGDHPHFPPPGGRFGDHLPFHFPHSPDDRMPVAPHIIALDGHVLGPSDESANQKGKSSSLLDPKSFHLAAAGGRIFSTAVKDGQEYRDYSVPLIHHGVIEAVLQVAYPLGDLHRVLDEVIQVLMALLPIEIVIAGMGGLFLTARALRPVQHIRDVTREITANDLSRRIEVRGRDEISELASTVNDMIARLEHSFEQQKQFVADVSHELRTPLATVKSSTTLALSQEREREAYQDALAVADKAVDRMHRLVEDLLLLARSDVNQIGLEIQPTSIGDVLCYASEMVNPVDKAPIELRPPDHSVMVEADIEYLVRVFVNLITNAARHTPASGRILLSAHLEGNTVVAEVSDTGEGISEEHLAHLGERFYRVDRSRGRLRGGTGLGLAISKSIVHAHGGVLEIRSQVNVGTTVSVKLPRYIEEGD